jgi:PAS domain S-box-containing protein
MISPTKSRLMALTSSADCTQGVAFTDLFDLADLQRLQDEFAAATGVASIITRIDGTPITAPSRSTRLCSGLIRNTCAGLSNCQKSDAVLGRYNPDGPTVRPCLSAGLWDAGVAISVGGRHVANWLIGQVRDEAQSEAQIRAYAHQIGADEEAVVLAYRDVPVMSRGQFQNVAQVLFTLANQLSDIAYQNIQQARFIAERELAEAALRASEESLRVSFASIGEAVIATDACGRVVRMNVVAERLTGWALSEASGRLLTEVFRIVNAHSRLPVDNPVERVLATGGIVEPADHIVLIARDGTELRIAQSGAPIRADAGALIGVVLMFHDVTQAHALQERVLLRQKMDAISQFAGEVAHDFNNMLTGIMGGTERLRRHLCPGDPEALRHLDTILKSAERATHLTRKLLSFARRDPTERVAFDAHKTIESAVDLLALTLDRRISLKIALEASDANVLGDAVLLHNVFLNLGINAANAMPTGGRLEFHSQVVDLDQVACDAAAHRLAPGRFLAVEVRDSGCGIPPEHLSRIFEPLFTTKPQGTGLGLSSAMGTVNQHGGTITVASSVGVGSCFRVLLPLLDRELCNSATLAPVLAPPKGKLQSHQHHPADVT